MKPVLTVICPAYNEEVILEKNLTRIHSYLSEHISPKHEWEILVVNDGSKDSTGKIADNFALNMGKTTVIHHIVNMNLGNALKTGFAHAQGDYSIVLDIDLSYDVNHIGDIFSTLVSTKADIVIASPYMKGGKVTAVPFGRIQMSRWLNRFMRIAAQEKFSTYTGMVRGYNTSFIKSINLKTQNYEINPEILYKAMILRARIIEIPGHLDWTEQNKFKSNRVSGMRIMSTFFSGLMAAFIFRPYIYFIGAGILLLAIALYIIAWIFINTFMVYPTIVSDPEFTDRFSLAVAQIYNERPYSFYVGGITLLAAFQILSLGFISLQNKRYFEESFHLATTIYRKILKSNKEE
jgi:glycosyltransferase involved in cell wall biosynthesis